MARKVIHFSIPLSWPYWKVYEDLGARLAKTIMVRLFEQAYEEGQLDFLLSPEVRKFKEGVPRAKISSPAGDDLQKKVEEFIAF